MEKEKTELKKFERQIQGPKLNQGELDSIISSLHSFEEKLSGLNEDEVKKRISEMASLLEVSQDKLEQVKQEKWFQRAWYTISGKNEKLMVENKINLIKIQKATLFFLEKLPELSIFQMETTKFLIDRFKILQIENERIKYYLNRIIDHYDKKIKNLELITAYHDQEIDIIKTSYLQFKIGFFILSLFAFAGSGILYLYTDNFLTHWVLSAIMALTGIFILFGFSFRKKRFRKDYNNRIIDNKYEKIKKQNSKIIPKLNDKIESIITEYCSDILISPLYEILETLDKINGYLVEFNGQEKLETNKFAKAIENTLYSRIFNGNLEDQIENNINFMFQNLEKFNKMIISHNIPESGTVRFKSDFLPTERNKFKINFLKLIMPISNQIVQLERYREQLLDLFPDYEEIITKNSYLQMGKEFAGGFSVGVLSTALLGPVGWLAIIGYGTWRFLSGKNKKEIIENFAEGYNKYFENLDTLKDSIVDTEQKIQLELNDFVSFYIEKLDYIWDNFTENKVSLEPLYKELNKEYK